MAQVSLSERGSRQSAGRARSLRERAMDVYLRSSVHTGGVVALARSGMCRTSLAWMRLP